MSKLMMFLALTGVSAFGLVMSTGGASSGAKLAGQCCAGGSCKQCTNCECDCVDGCQCCDTGVCLCSDGCACVCCAAKESATTSVATKPAACCAAKSAVAKTKSACCEKSADTSAEDALLAASGVVLATVADASRPANRNAGCCSGGQCELCTDCACDCAAGCECCTTGACSCDGCDCVCCAARK